MRIERWWWLLVFCFVSLLIHGVAVWRSHNFVMTIPAPQKPGEIEVALEPLPLPPAPRPEPEKKVKPEPKRAPKLQPKPEPKSPPPVNPARRAERRPVEIARRPEPRPVVHHTPPPERHPVAPDAVPGGVDPTQDERPMALGLPIGKRHAAPVRVARAVPNMDPGGGSPAPDPNMSGHGGAPGPEAPPEDILYNGGGAGGMKLPKGLSKLGGGGGNPVLSVPSANPLAEAVPDDTPGKGPGHGGHEGSGAGGGIGSARGKGIGTNPNGQFDLATLRRKPGKGIGAGEGDGTGTNPPGGGHGTGAELPGTGGDGIGYRRGKGIGIGDGSGIGVGKGGGIQIASTRGIPFGDVSGVLGGPGGGGGTGGGPGGPGRGALFSAPVRGGGGTGNGRLHIVYVLDISGSMRDGNKIGKAQAAMKQALSELTPRDSFTIITFNHSIYTLSDVLLPANRENIDKGNAYVDAIHIDNGTHLSDALDRALSVPDISHVFVASDGEPDGGIEDFTLLRAFVKDKNVRKAHILTLAVGLGEHFRGMDLLKGIAEDNDGIYKSVNLSR